MGTVSTALELWVRVPAVSMAKVGGGGGVDEPLAAMVAEPVVKAAPVWVACRPTLKVSAASTGLPDSIRIGMLICWVVGSPGLTSRARLETAVECPPLLENKPDRVEEQIVVG